MPAVKSAFVGLKTALKQNISLNDKAIQSINCLYGSRVFSIGFKAQSRNGLIQNINIGYPPDDPKEKTQTEAHELPPYQFIRCVTYFGTIETKPKQGPLVENSPQSQVLEARQKLNNGQPILQRNGATFIIPENLGVDQYIKLTGIMFDIVP